MDDHKPLSRREIEDRLLSLARQDETFEQRLMKDPRGVILDEFGLKVPDAIKVSVLKETSHEVYLVLPNRHTSEGVMSDEEMEKIAGGSEKETDFPV